MTVSALRSSGQSTSRRQDPHLRPGSALERLTRWLVVLASVMVFGLMLGWISELPDPPLSEDGKGHSLKVMADDRVEDVTKAESPSIFGLEAIRIRTERTRAMRYELGIEPRPIR